MTEDDYTKYQISLSSVHTGHIKDIHERLDALEGKIDEVLDILNSIEFEYEVEEEEEVEDDEEDDEEEDAEEEDKKIAKECPDEDEEKLINEAVKSSDDDEDDDDWGKF